MVACCEWICINMYQRAFLSFLFRVALERRALENDTQLLESWENQHRRWCLFILLSQSCLQVCVCLEWPTLAALMMAFKWFRNWDSMFVCKMSRASIFHLEHLIAAIDNTFEIFFSSGVCGCFVSLDWGSGPTTIRALLRSVCYARIQSWKHLYSTANISRCIPHENPCQEDWIPILRARRNVR